MGRINYCDKKNRRIEGNSENPVNPAVVGFPEWCPLETVEASETNDNYKKEVKQILRIMEDESNPDAILEASYYLNTVIENAKKKAETN
jgi:hypothetical protein